MNFARALVRDLVDKRLWPLAVLLVAALIAVPLLLGGGGDAGEGTPAPAAAVDEGTPVAAAQAAPAVELVGPPSVRSRPGALRDPFRRVKPKAAKTAVAQTPAAATKDTSKPAQATPTDSSPTDITPDLPPAPVAKPFAYRTEIRFAPADKATGKARGISRLTPLGGLTEPALLYLGVSADGKHATFLLGPAAQQNGEGRCSDDSCRIIGLKAGTTTVVDVTPATGESRQYVLEVVSVEREHPVSESVARTARAYVHPDGRDVLRDVIRDGATAQAVGKVMYVQALGVVVSKSTVEGAATGGLASGDTNTAP